jgi:uncharacterized protein YecE (DUF72 family)
LIGKVYIGTCNWADFKDWYPPALRPGERLRYYARHFSIVEIDSTFYALMPRRNFEAWAAATPDQFIFDVKAFRTLTRHGRVYAPGRSHQLSDPNQDATEEDFAKFIWQIEPLRDAGKLRAIQFQFPPWFEYSSANFDHIELCRRHMAAYLMAVEFRHQSWLRPEHRDITFAFLRDHGIVYTIADEPQVGSGTVPPLIDVTNNRLAIIRFHGRNAEKWRSEGGESGRARYDYLYDAGEMALWADTIGDLSTSASEVHVLMNNNVHGQGLVNGKQLQQLLPNVVIPAGAEELIVQTRMAFDTSAHDSGES